MAHNLLFPRSEARSARTAVDRLAAGVGGRPDRVGVAWPSGRGQQSYRADRGVAPGVGRSVRRRLAGVKGYRPVVARRYEPVAPGAGLVRAPAYHAERQIFTICEP